MRCGTASLAWLLMPLTIAIPVVAQPNTDKYQREVPPGLVEEMSAARSERRQGAHAAAIEKLDRVLEQQPDYYLALYNRALAKAQSGDTEEALLDFEAAAVVKQRDQIRDGTFYNSYGWTLYLEGRLGEAEQWLTKALETDEPRSSQTLRKIRNNLAAVHLLRGSYDDSRELLQQNVAVEVSDFAQRGLVTIERVQSAAPPPR